MSQSAVRESAVSESAVSQLGVSESAVSGSAVGEWAVSEWVASVLAVGESVVSIQSLFRTALLMAGSAKSCDSLSCSRRSYNLPAIRFYSGTRMIINFDF